MILCLYLLKNINILTEKLICSIVDGYRINDKVKHTVIQKYGYLDDLNQKYGDAQKYLDNELTRLKKEFET